jgi:hypothetical protein
LDSLDFLSRLQGLLELYPQIRTREDVSLLSVIGARQRAGDPISLKHLLADHPGAPATKLRRLRVLRAAGVLVFTPAASDRRVRLVRIAPKVMNTLKRQVG